MLSTSRKFVFAISLSFNLVSCEQKSTVEYNKIKAVSIVLIKLGSSEAIPDLIAKLQGELLQAPDLNAQVLSHGALNSITYGIDLKIECAKSAPYIELLEKAAKVSSSSKASCRPISDFKPGVPFEN